MSQSFVVQGRPFDGPELERLRQWLAERPDWSRWRLSRELALQWEWRNGTGQLKDMAARSLLVKLHQRGLIGLPQRRQVPTNRMGCGASPAICLSELTRAIQSGLADLQPLRLREVSQQAAERAWVKAALARFHYLGFGGAVGQNLQYVVYDHAQQPLACLVFGAAAWTCQARDQFIGWSAQQRQKNLALVSNNARFLILPWVKVPHLGSWVLGQVAGRIAQDWQAKYGHSVVLLETFVECERFRGTVYRAANWQAVGVTAGRTRQDRYTCLKVPAKNVYLYPLRRRFREMLQA